MNLEQIKERARRRAEEALKAERALIAELKADMDTFTEQDKKDILEAYAGAGYRQSGTSIEQMIEDIAARRIDDKARRDIVAGNIKELDKLIATARPGDTAVMLGDQDTSAAESGDDGLSGEGMFPLPSDPMSAGGELFEMEGKLT